MRIHRGRPSTDQGSVETPLGLDVKSKRNRAFEGSNSFSPVEINIKGRAIRSTPVFDTYWHFAHKRQELYLRRVLGNKEASSDSILQRHRFTNVYRASDRVSQYLIREVIYNGSQDPEDVVFRTLLFKFFNKIETWEAIRAELDVDAWSDFDARACSLLLESLRREGCRIYSAAYVIPPPRLGHVSKHANHLALLDLMMRDGLPERLAKASTLREVYEVIASYPSLGRFLAFQFSIDLNYSEAVTFDEADFVVAGPGAIDGVRKCFGEEAAGLEEQLIRWVAKSQDTHFSRLGLPFRRLGRRPLQLIDVQNVFCEVDKYARVAHPDIQGRSGRTRIKQLYKPSRRELPPPWFPPKWGIRSLV